MFTLITALRSALFMLIFYVGTIAYVLAGLAMAFVGHEPLARVAIGWGHYHRWCAHWILGQRIVVEGPFVDGPYLYIMKHESMFETIDVLCLLTRPAVAAKRELLDIPLWGKVARLYGLIPIEREAGVKAMRVLRRDARAAVAAGRPVCLFPEGTRVPHGERPPLKAGFAGLYQLLDLPVVPVAINSGIVSPRGRFLKPAGIITYRFADVVPAGLPRDEAEARVHAAINALNPPVPVDSARLPA